MKIYVITGYDIHDNYSWVEPKAYYLEEEADNIINQVEKFSFYIGDRCSLEAVKYECNKFVNYFDIDYIYSVEEIEVV